MNKKIAIIPAITVIAIIAAFSQTGSETTENETIEIETVEIETIKEDENTILMPVKAARPAGGPNAECYIPSYYVAKINEPVKWKNEDSAFHSVTSGNYENPDGESVLLLMSRKLLKEKIAYSETGNPLDDKKPPKEPNTKSIRTSKWKLIINEYNDTKELYNLENDPDEKNNLIGKQTDVEETLWKEFLRIQTGS